MSAKVSGSVWELDLSPTDKLVLLALADHADHDGKNVRPGNELLCAKTGLSQQRVTKAIANFVKLGVLVPINKKTGRTHKREFSINTEPIKKRQFFLIRERKKHADDVPLAQERYAKGVPLAEKRCADDVPLTQERYALGEEKVRPQIEKVRPQIEKVRFQTSAYKEGTIMNSHESSIETSERAQDGEEAAKIFEEVFGFLPTIFQREQFGVITDPAIWRKTLLDWKLDNYSIRKVSGMIEAYKANLLKTAKADGKNNKQTTGAYVGANSANVLAISSKQPAETITAKREGVYGRILDRLEETIGQNAVRSWFAPLEASEDSGTLYLQARDQIFQSWISNNYADQLAAAIEAEGFPTSFSSSGTTSASSKSKG